MKKFSPTKPSGHIRDMARRFWFAGGLAMAVFFITVRLAAAQAPPPVDAIVGRVNGDPILLSQLREAAIDQQAPLGEDLDLGVGNVAFRRALTQFVDETLLVQKARRDEIKVDPAELASDVDDMLGELRDQFGGAAGLGDWLAANHMTLDGLKRVLNQREERRSLAVKVVAQGVTVDAQSLDAFVAARKKDGGPLEQVNLAQILVACPEAEQKTQAGQDLYMKALLAAREAGRDPAKFKALVKEYSDDPGGQMRGGMLGWLDPEHLRPALRDRVAQMKVGDVSTPIASADGYHVLMLLARRSTRDLCFAEMFEKHRAELIQRLRANAQIQLYDTAGNPLKLSPETGMEARETTAPLAQPTPPPAIPVMPNRP